MLPYGMRPGWQAAGHTLIRLRDGQSIRRPVQVLLENLDRPRRTYDHILYRHN